MTFFAPGPVSADHGAVAARAAAIVEDVRRDVISMDEGMERLNAALRHFSQLRWWGQLQDLLTGERPFEREIRAWWRSQDQDEDEDDEGEDSSPIQTEEIDAFVSSLTDWGL